MLSFKQFINTYLFEANASHFAHLGLDPNNPEHKDIVDAYNNGLNAKENKITAKPNQIKTFDQLKTTVAPHFAAIQQKRKEDAEDKEAFENKDAELVHHDPETGLKVFKVRSGKGCAAVGGDSKWCVANRKSGQTAFNSYDRGGEHSYVIHTPEKGNLSKIGIIGVKPGQKHRSGLGGNFQDKGNNTVEDSDWEMLRKKYNLDSVKALHRIRGLHNEEAAKEREEAAKEHKAIVNNPTASDEDLAGVAEESGDPEIHRAIINHQNAGDQTLAAVAENSGDPEIHRAIVNHKKAGDNALTAVAKKSDNPEIHRAIANHKKAGDNALSHIAHKSNDPEVHRAIVNHKNAGENALEVVSEISEDPEVHRAIVNNQNAHDSYLDNVAHNSDDPEIHRAIINHKNAANYSFETVSDKSNDPEIHRAIANHKYADDSALGNVARRSNDPEIHRAIANHKNAEDYALETVSDKSNDPEIHKAIVNHPNAGDLALKTVAGHYNLEHDGSEESRQRISKAIDNHINSSKNTREHLIKPYMTGQELARVALYNNHPEIHRAIINHQNASNRTLYSVAITSRDPEIHRAVVNHQKAGEDALNHIARRSNDPEIHRAIANHQNAGEYALHNIAKKYNLEHDGSEESKQRISKAIDDHIKNKQNNPYQLESFLMKYGKR